MGILPHLPLFSFRSAELDFVVGSGFRLVDAGFRKFWWISWISIFRSTGRLELLRSIILFTGHQQGRSQGVLGGAEHPNFIWQNRY